MYIKNPKEKKEKKEKKWIQKKKKKLIISRRKKLRLQSLHVTPQIALLLFLSDFAPFLNPLLGLWSHTRKTAHQKKKKKKIKDQKKDEALSLVRMRNL